jgi:O-antigen/teichoic acid export membrane protein
VIVLITVLMALFMGWAGIGLLSAMYGVDFQQFGLLVFLMVLAGGVCAGIEFLYQIITVLRQQRQVMRIYLIAAVASVPTCIILVRLFGLSGAVWANLLVMLALFVLLCIQYARMRARPEPIAEYDL